MNVTDRSRELFDSRLAAIHRRVDELFAGLLVLQWVAGVAAAMLFTPTDASGAVHPNVWAAGLLGGVVSALPLYLALTRPGGRSTRHVVAVSQMLWSGLLIHFTGGRIETHFHVFGSLAFLAFYRDVRVLATATAVVVVDHLVRGALYPLSVYGVLSASPLRSLEHAGWVLFENSFLVVAGREALHEMRQIADRTADLEATNALVEERVADRTRELAEANRALAAASRAKSDFLATMSHEIRTPLNGVVGLSELLLETPLSPEQRDYAETVRVSSESLLGILSDILDLAKVEAGRLDLEAADFDLRALLAGVVRLFAASAHRKGISLTQQVDPGVPALVHGDAARLRQVLTNLVSNAIKFTHAGGVSLRVSRAEADDPRRLRFVVRDSGIGIDTAALARLFQPFSQADESTTRRYGGTGLGLVISQRLLGLMGGAIGVDSEPGRGSAFWFVAPLEAARSLSAPAPAGLSIPAPRFPSLPAGPFAGRVLVVEDNLVNQKVIARLLERRGLCVDLATSGREAVAEAGRRSYDLVLMDCQMPEMDGFDATRQLRAGGLTPPIVAITANALVGVREQCLEAGMDDYLTKPITGAALDEALGRWLPRSERPAPASQAPDGPLAGPSPEP